MANKRIGGSAAGKARHQPPGLVKVCRSELVETLVQDGFELRRIAKQDLDGSRGLAGDRTKSGPILFEPAVVDVIAIVDDVHHDADFVNGGWSQQCGDALQDVGKVLVASGQTGGDGFEMPEIAPKLDKGNQAEGNGGNLESQTDRLDMFFAAFCKPGRVEVPK